MPLIYGRHGDDYLVVASKGGSEHPAWYLNLDAIPRSRVATPTTSSGPWGVDRVG